MVPKPKPGQMAAGAAALGAGGAQASDGGIFGTGMTWGDVRSFGADVVNFGVDFLTPGGVGDVGRGSDIVPRGGAGKQAISGVSPRM